MNPTWLLTGWDLLFLEKGSYCCGVRWDTDFGGLDGYERLPGLTPDQTGIFLRPWIRGLLCMMRSRVIGKLGVLKINSFVN